MNDKNVFISYGHGTYDGIIKKLAEDLRGFGFQVFLDVDYLKMGDWEKIIDEHILGSKYFLFLVSARSVSRDGYCLNELCRAGENMSEIIPIRLDDSPIPLSINKHQRLSLIPAIAPDGTVIESVYTAFIQSLADILSGKAQLGFSDEEHRLRRCLKPVSSKELTYRYYTTFCGRRDVFAEIEAFLGGSKNIFWLNAAPGTGKTAFSGMLTWRYPQLVGAAHFCKFNNSDRANPKVIITSLAYQLSEALPAYRERLVGLMELDTLFEKNAARIFEYLIVEPLSQVDCDHPVMVIIDALDECSWRGSVEICSVLQRTKDSLPHWLKFVLTSRNEAEIRRILLPIAHTYTLSDSKTEDDLREYYRLQFPQAAEDTVELLLTKSEGSFLYASEIVKQIREENLSLDNINFFPIGIHGFFNDCFSRIFGRENSDTLAYDTVKPLLEFLCIEQEPTDLSFLEEFLEWDEYTLKNIIAHINGLFPVKNNYIEPLHKSLIDWLTSDDVGQIFYISRKNGYKRLLAYIEREYASGSWQSNKYVLKYFSSVLTELKSYDRLADILADYALQTKSIEYFEFDSGLENYLNQLKVLHEQLPARCVAHLSSETFIRIFSENRRLLYNSGMFFILKDLGLSVALRSDRQDWGLEGEIGKVFYYYIVEDFAKAIRMADTLLAGTASGMTNSLLSELYNVKGLSERKLVRFDSAIESFEKSIEYAELAIDEQDTTHSDAEFELSLAHLIKGKIFLSMLRFDESNRSCKKAIKVLSRKINEMPECDKRTSNRLFLAEDYRVAAYGYIWQGEYEMAEDRLFLADEIYRENSNTVDRYYIRYQYTSLFLKIMQRQTEEVIPALKALLRSATGAYDKGQINFLLALDIYRNHSDDSLLCEEGLRYAAAGSDIYDSIDALLEKAECDLLLGYLSRMVGKRVLIDSEENACVEQWIAYLDTVLSRQSTAGCTE